MSDLAKCPKCGMLMCTCDVTEIARLRAENARLWSENEAKAQGYRDVHEMLKASQRLNSIALSAIFKHSEDVLSLRAALERIIAQDDIALAEEGYREGFANVVRIARKALAESVTQSERSEGATNPEYCTPKSVDTQN